MDHLTRDFKFLFKTDLWLAVDTQNYAGIRFVVKQKTAKNTPHRLLFDGRHLRRYMNKEFLKPTVVYFLLNVNFTVNKVTKNIRGIPKNHKLPKDVTDVSLSRLLGGTGSSTEDPQDFHSTVAWLRAACPKREVKISFCFRLLPYPIKTTWIVTKKNDELSKKLLLDAFTGDDNRLRFRLANTSAAGRPSKKGVFCTKKLPEENNGENEDETFSESAHKNNRSSGVSVNLKGLAQAVRLGLVTSDEAKEMSKELGKAVGVMWYHTDSAKQVRHVAYRDGLGFFRCFEIYPSSPVLSAQEGTHSALFSEMEEKINTGKQEKSENRTLDSWNSFFDIVFERRIVLLNQKKKILAPLIEKFDKAARHVDTGGGLTQAAQCQSTVSFCIDSLKTCLKKARLVIISREDTFFHAIKLWLAHYLSRLGIKQYKGLYIRGNGKNEISSLVSSKIEVDNIARFFSLDKKSNLACEDEGEDVLSICAAWVPSSTLHFKKLPFQPLIDAKVSDLHHQGSVYSPGRISGYESGYTTCLVKRGKLLTDCILSVYQEFCSFLMEKYTYDLTSLFEFQSVPSVAFKCIWLSFYDKGGPLSHSIEKAKPQYEETLRNFCHGGFTYSCKSRLNSGDILDGGGQDSTGERASAMTEVDLTSCYGYSMKQLKVPGAFCIGYTLLDGHLSRTDKTQRTNTFEYQACMLLLTKMVASGYDILSVYSNFSPLGLFFVKKYPADLVVVTRGCRNGKIGRCNNSNSNIGERSTFIIQFDGRFIHGCSECKKKGTRLNRYANNSSEEDLISKSRSRDELFRKWISFENAKGGPQYTYGIIYDCHTPNLTTGELKISFETQPELKMLRDPYKSLPTHLLKLKDILNAHPGLTYLLVGRGQVPSHLRQPTPTRNGVLLVWKDDESTGKRYQDFGWETPEGGSLFTRDTLEYATREHNFQLESVSSCYFYRRCQVMPQVFDGLIQERQLCGSSQKSKAKFIKSMVNFGTGMLGYNPHNKTSTTRPRIVNHFYDRGRCLNTDLHTFIVGQIRDETFSLVQSTRRNKARAAMKKPCNVALPLYVSVVEYGRLRLLECLTFLFRVTRPGALKLCYSQVDCAVVAMAGHSLEETIDPALRSTFESEKKDYFTTTGEPGLLKNEWLVSTLDFPNGWKFASPYTCCYALVEANKEDNLYLGDNLPALKKIKLDDGGSSAAGGHSKASSFNNISTETVYLMACNSLDCVDMKIPQERRVNKMLNTGTATVSINIPFTNQSRSK